MRNILAQPNGLISRNTDALPSFIRAIHILNHNQNEEITQGIVDEKLGTRFLTKNEFLIEAYEKNKLVSRRAIHEHSLDNLIMLISTSVLSMISEDDESWTYMASMRSIQNTFFVMYKINPTGIIALLDPHGVQKGNRFVISADLNKKRTNWVPRPLSSAANNKTGKTARPLLSFREDISSVRQDLMNKEIQSRSLQLGPVLRRMVIDAKTSQENETFLRKQPPYQDISTASTRSQIDQLYAEEALEQQSVIKRTDELLLVPESIAICATTAATEALVVAAMGPSGFKAFTPKSWNCSFETSLLIAFGVDEAFAPWLHEKLKDLVHKLPSFLCSRLGRTREYLMERGIGGFQLESGDTMNQLMYVAEGIFQIKIHVQNGTQMYEVSNLFPMSFKRKVHLYLRMDKHTLAELGGKKLIAQIRDAFVGRTVRRVPFNAEQLITLVPCSRFTLLLPPGGSNPRITNPTMEIPKFLDMLLVRCSGNLANFMWRNTCNWVSTCSEPAMEVESP
jgi:hypothetical protein